MPLIYLETNRIAEGVFELIQSTYMGASATNEKILPYDIQENDRLYAAILNAGFAARELSDCSPDSVKVIGIESDVDGKDSRYSGEHDVLLALLAPASDFEARRLRSLYGRYNRYLGRIQQLILAHDIKVVKQIRGEDVRYN